MQLFPLDRLWVLMLQKLPWNISHWVSTQSRQRDYLVMPGHADLAVATSPTSSIFIRIKSFDYHRLIPSAPPCLKPWFIKALKSDLSSITDNSFTWASCLFSHSSLCNYVISWAYHRWSHEAISEMTVSICVYVCMSLRSATCWHMYLSLIVIKLCARPAANF